MTALRACVLVDARAHPTICLHSVIGHPVEHDDLEALRLDAGGRESRGGRFANGRLGLPLAEDERQLDVPAVFDRTGEGFYLVSKPTEVGTDGDQDGFVETRLPGAPGVPSLRSLPS